VGQFQQHYRGYGCGLVEQLGHKQPSRLKSVLVRILLLMAMSFKQVLGSYSMDLFLQRYRDYEYDLEERLGRKLVDQLMFVLEHIWQQMAMFFMLK